MLVCMFIMTHKQRLSCAMTIMYSQFTRQTANHRDITSLSAIFKVTQKRYRDITSLSAISEVTQKRYRH